MYNYNEFDAAFVAERNKQFRHQVERRIAGHLTEDEFKPLRLMNGLYLQLHAYMLRVAIPYGTLNAVKMRKLAEIAERWDKGYGHFTTRQNIQYNWPKLSDVPDMLDALAEVDMHAIQTSGNTIRNVTADHFAGAAADEIADPRPVAELIRQWSTDHAEFQFLPRKFKIAVTGSPNDRAVIKAHDIGIQIVEQDGEVGYRIIVGGGLGRTPMIGKVIRDFVAEEDLLPYLEAVVGVWNLLGRRETTSSRPGSRSPCMSTASTKFANGWSAWLQTDPPQFFWHRPDAVRGYQGCLLRARAPRGPDGDL